MATVRNRHPSRPDVVSLQRTADSQIGCNGPRDKNLSTKTPWCFVGNGGMDIGDYYWGLYKGSMDPFPHSLLRTRQKTTY